ncbi:WD40 repeat-like protein [Metschnikowia bicuspidata var. bicuspidata NRRL YB-4993]|uniref:WD40 repeat-like protein n=1 Tax=Metschnikowia bicuspidata var. bicuspidata NRRL YB-4993 TaxID=869754 RepID=A0A1A0HFY2_9ASCO|nr:WD40 repeat-like protein [Metschnikowia bicuspidata var. bicuspidata NRRL YB-4993]OBA22911.1 WD40 repeat-like protein [Metschnikowia bicuspidata var. bicuspidata NRRL YB-4993]
MSLLHGINARLESPLSVAQGRSQVNYITFNQDASCVALGLESGYRIYSCKPNISKCLISRREESVGIIEMLYCTSLVAIVGLGEEVGSLPRKLKILNSKRQTTICDLIFPSTILLVKLSHQRMVVLLEEQIYIYDIKNMNLLHTIETSPNLNLLCALSDNYGTTGTSLLAYPSPPKTITHESLLVNGLNTNGGLHSVQNNIQSVSNAPNRVGDAIIFDLTSLQPLAVIEAHKSALSAMCISIDGSLLATASDKGTIVRVFNVNSGVKLYQFRRGTYPTKIFSLSFSIDNKYVVATSSSETVHIFRLGENELLANKQKQSRNSRPKGFSGEFKYQTIEEEIEGLKFSKDGGVPFCENASSRLQEEGERLNTNTKSNEHQLEDNEDGDITDDADEIVEDDGDDSDVEGDDYSDDGMMDLSNKPRKLSQSSSNSFNSLTSGYSNISGGDELRDRSEPIIDQNRLSVARLIRRSSQHLGRKAAQKMGDYLPSRFSSILEPTRHFASLKLQTMGKDVKSIAIIDDKFQGDKKVFNTPHDGDGPDDSASSTFPSNISHSNMDPNIIHINVITSDGYYYTYGLDTERGGDCILLHQDFLLDD